MRVIKKAHIKYACTRYPDAKNALEAWHQKMVDNVFNNFTQVRQSFNSVDQVGRATVFNIKGNQYRLIAAIHYNRKWVYVLEVMTHAEYDKDSWKNKYKIYD